jgi:hypothetical protein
MGKGDGPRARGRTDPGSAMTRGACENRGINRSSQGLLRHARRQAHSEWVPLDPRDCLQRVTTDSDRRPPFSMSDAVVAGNPHLHRHLQTVTQRGCCFLHESPHGLLCGSDSPHVRPSTEHLCLPPSILITRQSRNSCPSLAPVPDPSRALTKPAPAAPPSLFSAPQTDAPAPFTTVSPVAVSRAPFIDRRNLTNSSEREIGDGLGPHRRHADPQLPSKSRNRSSEHPRTGSSASHSRMTNNALALAVIHHYTHRSSSRSSCKSKQSSLTFHIRHTIPYPNTPNCTERTQNRWI